MTPLTYGRAYSTQKPHGEGGNRTHALVSGTARPICGARPKGLHLMDPIQIGSEVFEHLNGVARITPAELPRYVDCQRCLKTLRAAVRSAGGKVDV